MLYSTGAEMMKLSSNPTAAAIEVKSLRAGGSTNFVAAFDLIRSELKARVAGNKSKAKGRMFSLRSAPERKRKLFVFFMTDGCDTCNNAGSVSLFECVS